jgi:hypothetical protein
MKINPRLVLATILLASSFAWAQSGSAISAGYAALGAANCLLAAQQTYQAQMRSEQAYQAQAAAQGKKNLAACAAKKLTGPICSAPGGVPPALAAEISKVFSKIIANYTANAAACNSHAGAPGNAATAGGCPAGTSQACLPAAANTPQQCTCVADPTLGQQAAPPTSNSSPNTNANSWQVHLKR